MTKLFISILLSIILFSCQNHKKFDKTKWAETRDLMTFPNRKYMVDDLLKTYQLKGKKLNNIVELLGDPQSRFDSTFQILYDIDIKYGSDIDPIYTKKLDIIFDKDTAVKSFEILEWKK